MKIIRNVILCPGRSRRIRNVRNVGYMVEKGNKLVCSQETCGYVEAKDEKEN